VARVDAFLNGHGSPLLRSGYVDAYARIGDRAGCHAGIRLSEEMAGRIRPGEEPPRSDTSSRACSRCSTLMHCAASAT
jgi:hypothetical protein